MKHCTAEFFPVWLRVTCGLPSHSVLPMLFPASQMCLSLHHYLYLCCATLLGSQCYYNFPALVLFSFLPFYSFWCPVIHYFSLTTLLWCCEVAQTLGHPSLLTLALHLSISPPSVLLSVHLTVCLSLQWRAAVKRVHLSAVALNACLSCALSSTMCSFVPLLFLSQLLPFPPHFSLHSWLSHFAPLYPLLFSLVMFFEILLSLQ